MLERGTPDWKRYPVGNAVTRAGDVDDADGPPLPRLASVEEHATTSGTSTTSTAMPATYLTALAMSQTLATDRADVCTHGNHFRLRQMEETKF
jgi:hypothetical protein